MHLYNLTLQGATAIKHAVVGSFAGGRTQEMVLAKGGSLELVRVEIAPDESARLVQLIETPVFGVIRSLASFRVTGGSKDYIVVESDSGRIAILEYMPATNSLVRVHLETYGKSGVRRIVPGEYLATDPKGRAVMIGALEKQKFVYILNRDAATRLTISSPLEAHKNNTITFSLIGVDVAFDNPIFAAIEVDYSDVDADPNGEMPVMVDKVLTYYELDLGLNHVVRKWTDPIDPTAHLLIQVPGGSDGPSGVLVCSENWITWKHQDHADVRVPIPRRVNYLEDPSRGLLINTSVTHRLKNRFFVLVQSEEGDLYRVTMTVTDGQVTSLNIKYFDTVPVASSLVILKAGYLLVTPEFGNQVLFRIEDLGDSDDEQPEYTSDECIDGSFVYFKPRPLRNLAQVHAVDAPHPLIDAKVLNLANEETPQIYALCGRGAQSTFRIMRPGLDMAEIAVTDVPDKPTAIWTTKLRATDPVDAYIVVSFPRSTVVFAVGESVEEVTDSGFLGDVPTLLIQQLGDDDLVQVHPHGIRHIKADKRTFEWKAPANRYITHATANRRQIMVALNGGELVYFELDPTNLLNEYPERKIMSAPVTCLDLGEVPRGRLRHRFAAVGCADNTVRVFSLDPDACLEGLSMQALTAAPESLCMITMRDPNGMGENPTAVYLNIGLQNGVLIRSTVDQGSGELLDSRLRFLGPKSPKLFRVSVAGENALLALSTRTWLHYAFQGRVHMHVINYDPLDYAAPFASELFSEGLVAIAGNTVRILMPDKLGRPLQHQTVELNYTPRAFVHHPTSHHFVVLEADQNTYAPAELDQLLKEKAAEYEDESVVAYRDEFPESQYGLIKARPGKWASCVRVLNPTDGMTAQLLHLDPDEAAMSCALVQFTAQPSDMYVIVGTVLGLEYPRTHRGARLRTYKFIDDGTHIALVHITEVDDVPRAMTAFQGRVAVGVGNALRIYDLGKKKLLKKCEASTKLPTLVTWIGTMGVRLVVADLQESLHYFQYRPQDNRLVAFADDAVPRWVTAAHMIDYDTVAGGDRFGNFFVDRLPQQLAREIDEDPTGNRVLYDKPFLNAAPHKLDHVANYFLGDWVTSVTKAALVLGGRETLVYTTLGGSIGCLVPLMSKDDVAFFQLLEIQMRNEAHAQASLVGRDHLRFRSTYLPVKNVTDGDLCEQFLALPLQKKQLIAEEMDRTVLEITKKLEDIRARSAF
ncbi:Splicing factor 3B subunit 3 [Allomyces javanicus]|nr:Splicing factor 3B subunit 3 [Allomyces javanicus]